MKKALLLVVVAIIMAACTKEGMVSPGYFGKYELRASYGGLAGFNNKYQPGNGNIFEFKSDSTFVRYEKNKAEESGVYHIKIDTTVNGAKFGTIVLGTNNYPEAFSIKADTITIGTTLTDGIASDYVKIQ
ncbi:hypothetical protein FFF34_016585 [Inquilinus sp. KBS0705]|nr:hypothetical protein FFF34_016585 [Inquilinus sp. KBS0705]